MKITLIGPEYPYRGGIAQSQALLEKQLVRQHEVSTVNFIRQYPDALFPGKSQYEEDVPKEFLSKTNKGNRWIDTINPITWYQTARKIAAHKPDVVIFSYWMPFFAPCYSSIAFLIKKFCGAQIIYLCHNILPHEKQPGQTLLTKALIASGDAFMVLSDSVEQDLVKLTDKPYRKAPHPIYNSFGPAESKSEARTCLKKDYDLDLGEAPVMLFFGFIRAYKGLHHLLEAMPTVLLNRKIKLLIVGEFYEDEQPYREQINSLGIAADVIIVSKYVSNHDVRHFFCAADLVVQPYITATQSGISQIAYFYNRPMISTRVGALSEVVIEGKTGFIVSPGDSEELSNAIIRFYEENREKEFAAHIEQEKTKYSWEYFCAQLAQLFPVRVETRCIASPGE